VVDVPLLYETGADDKFERVIVTTCAPDLQIARLMARGLTEPAARQRVAAQWPAERKNARADFVIRTDGTFAETDAQLDAILTSLNP
jgi:dephospho-CoA kinase